MDIEAIAPLKRCAIYTRKSTNQRLEHDVNSLVTQREISSAYVKSQQYKGWVELPNRYDDGGHSNIGNEDVVKEITRTFLQPDGRIVMPCEGICDPD